ncbi:hypothetical protein HK102_012263 [Quaeritorhiza haematococci]|nr:hypothetical protein HK102_012263 [Quaeritorhiza haematococci]
MPETDHGKGTARKGTEMDGVELHVGDKIEYHPVEGGMQTTVGEIIDIFTHPEIASSTHKHVKASEDEPRYLIRNEHTHKETAYYKKAIEKKI